MCQVESNVLALVVVDMDGDFLDEVDRLAVGRFEAFQIGPENVIGLAGGDTLGEFAHMVGVDLPAGFVGLIFSLADFHRDAVHGAIIGAPDGSGYQSVRLPSGFLSCEQAIPRTESWKENESGDNSEQ
jgi:hypothetical protein